VALDSLGPRGTLLEVRVSSDPNPTLRLRREIRGDLHDLTERVGRIEQRLDSIESTRRGIRPARGALRTRGEVSSGLEGRHAK
jgi:hypothetical protein